MMAKAKLRVKLKKVKNHPRKAIHQMSKAQTMILVKGKTKIQWMI